MPVHAYFPRLAPLCLATLLAIGGGDAMASDWLFSPSLTQNIGYSDNAKLTASNRQSEWFSETTPGISFTSGAGPRAHLDGNVSYVYSEHSGDKSRNQSDPQLALNGNAELVQQSVYVDGNASIAQQNQSLTQSSSFPGSNANQTTVKSYRLSPYYQRAFSDTATVRLRYDATKLDTGTASNAINSANSTGGLTTLALNSGPAFDRIGWGVNLSNEEIDYKARTTNTHNETASGTGSFKITPRVQFVGTFGWEKLQDDTYRTNPEDTFWSAGGVWQPSEQTNLSAQFGRRFFGDTRNISFSRTGGMTVINVTYVQDITNTRGQFIGNQTFNRASVLNSLFANLFPDAATRAEQVNNYIRVNGLTPTFVAPVALFTDQNFLQRRLDASLAIVGLRNTLTFSAFMLNRDASSLNAPSTVSGAGDFAISEDIHQRGLNVTLDHRLDLLTSLGLAGGFEHDNYVGAGTTDNSYFYQASMTRQLGQHLSGRIQLRRVQRDSTVAAHEYTEDSLLVGAVASF